MSFGRALRVVTVATLVLVAVGVPAAQAAPAPPAPLAVHGLLASRAEHQLELGAVQGPARAIPRRGDVRRRRVRRVRGHRVVACTAPGSRRSATCPPAPGRAGAPTPRSSRPRLLGRNNGWPGESGSTSATCSSRRSVLRSILDARLDMCAQKGFDMVELDNVDGYSQPHRLPAHGGRPALLQRRCWPTTRTPAG